MDYEDVLEFSEKLSNIIGSILSMFLIVSMFGDLLGINVFEALRMAFARPWVVPTEWIEAYYVVWYGMEWCLLLLMLVDQVYTMRYMQSHGTPPPLVYERWMSFTIFILSFWLTLILRYFTFTLITIFAAISFSYTMFIRRE